MLQGSFRRCAVIAAWAALILSSNSSFAQGEHVESSTIALGKDVITNSRFEGLKRVDADAVRIVMATRAGRRLDPAQLSDDLRAIYGTGYFEDVSVYKEVGAKGAIELVFVLK